MCILLVTFSIIIQRYSEENIGGKDFYIFKVFFFTYDHTNGDIKPRSMNTLRTKSMT